MDMQKATIQTIYYRPGIGMATLSQGHRRGSSPSDCMVLGGGNGSFVTTQSEHQSKFTAIVHLEDGTELEIPIKHAIREATGWEKITKKRADLIQKNFPKNVHIYQDESNGYCYISDDDMMRWGNMLCY